MSLKTFAAAVTGCRLSNDQLRALATQHGVQKLRIERPNGPAHPRDYDRERATVTFDDDSFVVKVYAA